MKFKLVLFLLIGVYAESSGQSDCGINYAYQGKVLSATLNVEGISVPNTRYMDSTANSEDLPSLRYIQLKDSVINEPMNLELSSHFCQGINSVVKNIFKKREYLIRVLGKPKAGGKHRIIELKIPVDKIKFKVDKEKHEIIIQLPDIRV